MAARTLRLRLVIVLVCVFTETLSYTGLMRWLNSRNSKDYSEIVNFLSSSYPFSNSDQSNVCLNNRWRDQILKFFTSDEKTERFLECESPSFNKQIINLAQRSAPVTELVGQSMAKETTGTVVPMSTSVIVQTMALNPAQRAEIERRTRRSSVDMYAEMRVRLTANLFGSICLEKTSEAISLWLTSPHPRINIWTNEQVLRSIQAEIKSQMKQAGLIVDKTRGYLAAVPDGLIGDKTVVKVHVVQRPRKKMGRARYVIADELSPQKPLYYEIQGLLAVTDREECILVTVSRELIKTVTVRRNREFWKTKMQDKIEKFCMNILLPELSKNVLPDINDIRKAAAMMHVVTTHLPLGQIAKIIATTQKDGFDTFMVESKIRLLPEHFHVILDEKKNTKTKMREILECYYQNREDWEFRRRLKMTFVQRFVATNKFNVDLDFGGLVIDNMRGYLAAFPSVFGYSREKKENPNKARRPCIIFEVVTPVVWKNSKPSTLDDLDFMVSEEGQEGKRYSLRKDSKYYYKVQGSMAIARTRSCVFMVGFPGLDPVHAEMIDFDVNLWEDMDDKLDRFYYSSFLMFHACPEAFNHLVRGPSLKDVMGWQTDPPTNPEMNNCASA